MTKNYSVDVEVPQGITFEVIGSTVKLKGSKGELQRTFLNPRMTILKEGSKLVFKGREGLKFAQVDKMMINSCRAHINNMIKGVNKEYIAKLKICSGHFPMTVTLDGSTVSIKNFLGEKVPRKARLSKDIKVQIQGDIIVVTGLDKEKVGQGAATIEQTTRITNKDRRIFQDGCFIILKPGVEDE